MVSFLFVPNGWADSDADWKTTQFLFAALACVSFSNILDASLALPFVFLCIILLVHRAVWPLLVRTVFRVQEAGTKARRAILTTIGLALLSTSVFGGKIPDLLQEVIKSLGG